ncbi:hypothetical protein F511_19691 [Dorcoceras hygrometricum]|uniref:Uncharacterized protein n=1 Tax=Dorcoceras hygrometricum TaxID=472368 RepID=A0A2Z7AKZ6_9LAMI|nr:hypothetical protein F511_19691 [Dorcoceras hygrometricum]
MGGHQLVDQIWTDQLRGTKKFEHKLYEDYIVQNDLIPHIRFAQEALYQEQQKLVAAESECETREVLDEKNRAKHNTRAESSASREFAKSGGSCCASWSCAQVEHSDVLSMQMDSDLVIYRTTLVRTLLDKDLECTIVEHSDVLSMQMDSDLVIYRTTLVRTFQRLDLPMIVDLIGIFVLKGPYYTLTMTDWFLQAISVIPTESWGDVARRFTMIRWLISFLPLLSSSPSPPSEFCSDRSGEEIPSVKLSLGFLVQTGEVIGIPIVDRIRRPIPSTIEVPISS